jgi:hypothetical protein
LERVMTLWSFVEFGVFGGNFAEFGVFDGNF